MFDRIRKIVLHMMGDDVDDLWSYSDDTTAHAPVRENNSASHVVRCGDIPAALGLPLLSDGLWWSMDVHRDDDGSYSHTVLKLVSDDGTESRDPGTESWYRYSCEHFPLVDMTVAKKSETHEELITNAMVIYADYLNMVLDYYRHSFDLYVGFSPAFTNLSRFCVVNKGEANCRIVFITTVKVRDTDLPSDIYPNRNNPVFVDTMIDTDFVRVPLFDAEKMAAFIKEAIRSYCADLTDTAPRSK